MTQPGPVPAPTDEHLVYVDDSQPGITRRKLAKGWAYFDANGKRIKDRAEIDRLNAVGLPPAYVDAWFCPDANGHILATGTDARGRKQYRYNPDFRAAREAEKFDATAAFGRLLPLVRARVEADLAGSKLSRERGRRRSDLRLLDSGGIRVGNAAYAKANKSFGATTLKMRHAALKGSVLKLRFRAKGGGDARDADRRQKPRAVRTQDAGFTGAVLVPVPRR
ncbi:MAG: hypothetical protein NVS3B27_11010 [Novosphingobium sp.]